MTSCHDHVCNEQLPIIDDDDIVHGTAAIIVQ
jgi:hypothetical protein